jgi:glycerol-3-phosphate dehydrogenase (NAD(P)+)
LYGISGLGDVIVTAMSSYSRNRQAGKLLAEGKTLEQILQGITMTIESFSALDALPFLLAGQESDFPLFSCALRLFQGERLGIDSRMLS